MGISWPRILFLEIPVILLFTIYLSLISLHQCYEKYLAPQIEALEWTDERAQNEWTYYNRYCDADDFSASTASSFFLDESSSAQEAQDLFLEHGYVFFPQVLSRTTASRFREFVLKKNREEDPIGGDNILHSPENRWLITLGTEDDPIVADVLQEVANNPQFVSSIEKILGPNPALIEMDVITSSPGAEAQELHSDGTGEMSPLAAARSYAPTHVLLMQLQDTSEDMGATQVCPGTHFCMDGPFEEQCERQLVPVANEMGYWPAGGAALMNTNAWHRGGPYKLANGPHRSMLVLTFSSRPEPRAESRMLTQGLSYSLPLHMWGHTLHDMRHAHRIMKRPWTYLRALGLYKRWDSPDWGVDYVTLTLRRFANEYEGVDDVGATIEYLHGTPPYGLILRWLGWEFPDCESSTELAIEIMNRAKDLTWRWCIAASLLVILLPSWKKSTSGKQTYGLQVSLWKAAARGLRMLLTYNALLLLFALLERRISRTGWAVDISNQRRNFVSFEATEKSPYDDEPTTYPWKTDVLIETRFGLGSLAMYNDFTSFHPGNRRLKELVTSHLSTFNDVRNQSGAFPSALRSAIVEDVVGQLELEDNTRFLHQSIKTGAWHKLPHAAAIEITEQELILTSLPLHRTLLRELRFLESNCRFGFRRSTSLCQNHTIPHIKQLAERLALKPRQTQRLSPTIHSSEPRPRRFVTHALPIPYQEGLADPHVSPSSRGLPKAAKYMPDWHDHSFVAGDGTIAKIRGGGYRFGRVHTIFPSGEVEVHFLDGDIVKSDHNSLADVSDELYPGRTIFMQDRNEEATIVFVDAKNELLVCESHESSLRFKLPLEHLPAVVLGW